MNWYPNKRLGLVCGLGLLAALLLASYSLLARTLHAPIDLATFGQAALFGATLPLLAAVGYAFLGLANLAYRVERNGIAIRWGAGHDVIPMGEIREIVPFPAGRRLAGGIGWPGYRVGQVWVEGLGRVRLYTTGRPEQGLLIRTAERSYLISPAKPDGFMANYRVRRALGALVQWPQGQRVPRLMGHGIWWDRTAGWLFLAGLLLNVALFGYLSARYPGLPARLILSFDPHGLGDRIGARSELFQLPIVALGMLALNAILAVCVHRRERALALLLLGNAPLVQVLAWLAAWRLAG